MPHRTSSLDPGDQFASVGMAEIKFEQTNMCLDLDLFALNAHAASMAIAWSAASICLTRATAFTAIFEEFGSG